MTFASYIEKLPETTIKLYLPPPFSFVYPPPFFSFDVYYSVNYFNWDLHHFGLTEMGTKISSVPSYRKVLDP